MATRISVLMFLCCTAAACSVIYDTDDYSFLSTSDMEEVCQSYCTTVGEACRDEFEQYSTSTSCLQTCKTLPAGTMDDEIGNTVGCRMHYALEAVEDSSLCLAAGPGGNGICGSNCEGFCQIQEQTCIDSNDLFASITECASVCTNWDDSIPYSSTVENADNLACRLYHLTVATTSPSIHCPHAADDSSICF